MNREEYERWQEGLNDRRWHLAINHDAACGTAGQIALVRSDIQKVTCVQCLNWAAATVEAVNAIEADLTWRY